MTQIENSLIAIVKGKILIIIITQLFKYSKIEFTVHDNHPWDQQKWLLCKGDVIIQSGLWGCCTEK